MPPGILVVLWIPEAIAPAHHEEEGNNDERARHETLRSASVVPPKFAGEMDVLAIPKRASVASYNVNR